MENKRIIKLDDINSENMERFDCYKREITTWSKEKRQAAKIIYEVKVEDGKSYNSLFAILALLINPSVSILLKWKPEYSCLYLIVIIAVIVSFVLVWVSGRHRLYENIAVLKLLEEIDENECSEAIEENKEESDVLS